MKIKNPFFKKNNNINLSDICKILGVKRPKKDLKINNISDLESSSKYDISFLVLINENKGSYWYCKYANTSGERQRALGTPFCTMHICTRVSVCYILHMSHGKKIQSSSKLSLPS